MTSPSSVPVDKLLAATEAAAEFAADAMDHDMAELDRKDALMAKALRMAREG